MADPEPSLRFSASPQRASRSDASPPRSLVASVPLSPRRAAQVGRTMAILGVAASPTSSGALGGACQTKRCASTVVRLGSDQQHRTHVSHYSEPSVNMPAVRRRVRHRHGRSALRGRCVWSELGPPTRDQRRFWRRDRPIVMCPSKPCTLGTTSLAASLSQRSRSELRLRQRRVRPSALCDIRRDASYAQSSEHSGYPSRCRRHVALADSRPARADACGAEYVHAAGVSGP